MRYFPVNLDLNGRLVVVVGGGAVALRKVRHLLEAAASVRVIAPQLTPELEQLAVEGTIEAGRRPYCQGDLRGAALALAATDDPDVNALVAAEAKERGVPVNVADSPEVGNCILPAIVAAGDVTVTVSSEGRCPAFSRWFARRIEEQLGPEYAAALELAAAVREKLLTDPGRRAYNRQILAELLDADLPGLLRDGRLAEIDALLLRTAGPEYALERLPLRTLPPWRLPTN